MKIEEQVLSIEQMKHLQELGVDTSDASMAYYNISRDNQPDKWILGIANKEVATVMLSNGITEMEPAYTTGDLIEKLPKTIGIYHLMIDWNLMQIEYTNWSWQESVFRECFTPNDKPLINTLYDCLCWVAENHKELLEKRNG